MLPPVVIVLQAQNQVKSLLEKNASFKIIY